MLTIEKFEEKINIQNSPGWLRISVDETNDEQLYVTGYAGMGETMSSPIALHWSRGNVICRFALIFIASFIT
tara:strand:+ start:894 stop:1109 length:216 start_codon:yes stop_codon:yes gene_type:complete